MNPEELDNSSAYTIFKTIKEDVTSLNLTKIPHEWGQSDRPFSKAEVKKAKV